MSAIRETGMFPYVTSKNIRHWNLDKENLTYVDRDFHDSIYPRCNAEYGDVLLTKDGANTGQITINTFNEPISLLSSVCLIKPKKDLLEARYLVYYVQSDDGFENITGQMTGAAIKRIILKHVKTSLIPIPSLEEQKRIVAVLDQAFAALDRARAHAEANLADVLELKNRSVDYELSSDTLGQTETIGQHVDLLTGFAFKSNAYSDAPKDIRLIRGDNIVQGTFRWDGVKRWPHKFRSSLPEF